MTEPTDEGQQRLPERIIVPGAPARAEYPDDPDGFGDVTISDEQQVRDLGSASRSCVAIIAAMLVIALLICVFLVWAFVIR